MIDQDRMRSRRDPGDRTSSASSIKRAFAGSTPERIRFVTLLIFLFLCAVGGGSSFVNVGSLLYLRPAAVLAFVIFLATPGRIDIATFKAPFIFLGLFGLVIGAQLIPLPPEVWLSMPGRERFAEAAAAAGLPQPWRPISLTPDLTWNALVSLVVPLAVLCGLASIRRDQREALAPVVIALLCLSAIVGIAQFAAGPSSPLYLYRPTHEGAPVGLLANRNHQAVLLSLMFPLLRLWASRGKSDAALKTRGWIGIALGLLILPIILATGSRAGAAIAILMLVVAAFLVPERRRRGVSVWKSRAIKFGIPIAGVLILAATFQLGRAVSIERLSASEGITSDLRFQYIPLTVDITREFFPFGTGIGSFDPVYRVFEPDEQLSPVYVNRAHNDLLELAMTTGLPGLALLIAFLTWVSVRAWRAWIGERSDAGAWAFVRLGAAIVLALFAASLVDYPLRTPFAAAIFVIGCGWLCHAVRREPVRRPV